MAEGAPDLASLGYQMVAGPSGSKGDFVLRQLKDPKAGFVWAGEENFSALGKAVFRWCKQQLVSLCGLEALSGYGGATPYATPGFNKRAAPVLVLLCGDVPGGDAGTWSRRLVINDSTRAGAMFEQIFSAQQRGWSVVVPDHNGADAPHQHMQQLWQKLLRPSSFTKLLMVGHSYGGPVGLSLFKSEPEACDRLGAVVTTDGMAWGVAGWGSIEQIDETVYTEAELATQIAINKQAGGGSGESAEEMREMRDRGAKFAEMCPKAFTPPSNAVRMCVASLTRNYAASTLPVGTTIRVEPANEVLVLSAGVDSHGETTGSCIEHAFGFLESGALGTAAIENAQTRLSGGAPPPSFGAPMPQVTLAQSVCDGSILGCALS